MISKKQFITWLGSLVSLGLLLALSWWLGGCSPQALPSSRSRQNQITATLTQPKQLGQPTPPPPPTIAENLVSEHIWEKATLDDIQFGPPRWF